MSTMVALAAAETLPYVPTVPRSEVRVGIGKPTLASELRSMLASLPPDLNGSNGYTFSRTELSELIATTEYHHRSADRYRLPRVRRLATSRDTLQEELDSLTTQINNRLINARNAESGSPTRNSVTAPIREERYTPRALRLQQILEQTHTRGDNYTFTDNELVLLADQLDAAIVADPKDKKSSGKPIPPLAMSAYGNIHTLVTRGRERTVDPAALTPIPGTLGVRLGEVVETGDALTALAGQQQTNEQAPVPALETQQADVEKERIKQEESVLRNASRLFFESSRYVYEKDGKRFHRIERAQNMLTATTIALNADPKSELGRQIRSDTLRYIRNLQEERFLEPEKIILRKLKEKINSTPGIILERKPADEHPLLQLLTQEGLTFPPEQMELIKNGKAIVYELFTPFVTDKTKRKQLEAAWKKVVGGTFPLDRMMYFNTLIHKSNVEEISMFEGSFTDQEKTIMDGRRSSGWDRGYRLKEQMETYKRIMRSRNGNLKNNHMFGAAGLMHVLYFGIGEGPSMQEPLEIPDPTPPHRAPTADQRRIMSNIAEQHIRRADVPSVLLAKAANMAVGQEAHAFRMVLSRMMEEEQLTRRGPSKTSEALAREFPHNDQQERDFHAYLRRKLLAKKKNIETAKLPEDEAARHTKIHEQITRRTLVNMNLDELWQTIMGDIPMTAIVDVDVLKKHGKNKKDLANILSTYAAKTGEPDTEKVARHAAAELMLRVLVWQADHPPASPIPLQTA